MKKLFTLCLLALSFWSAAQSTQTFTLKVIDPSTQQYHVEMVCSNFKETELVLTLPNWTPGYYQMLNYAQYVQNFNPPDEKGKTLTWKKLTDNAWSITRGKSKQVKITYTVKATIPFVAQSLLDAEHGYIMPAGVFMHVRGYLKQPVTLSIQNFPQWSTIATGLEPVKGKPGFYTATDFDTFYDSPILLGNLEELPSFNINSIPHRFIGYKVGDFDKQAFINDLHKIVQAGVDVIGDIPYNHYTFLAAGPIPGGIEHLNSTGFGFSSNDFHKRGSLVRMYTFLSHEYFHHYNAKRIRPIELGPFDYDKGSKTTMLWIAEGFTNYYDELLVKRAGVTSREEYLKSIENRISDFENKPGRLFQTASQASYETWTDGPFGRTGDDAYKTISVYEKGSLLGLVLDLTIRQNTQNKKSLDDVMRYVYTEYYKKQNRGFTEQEFKTAAEKVTGLKLAEFFDYVNTVKEIPYGTYLSYAGLALTETSKQLPDPIAGLTVRERNDSLVIVRAEWESPAWKAGLRSNEKILLINGEKATKASYTALQNQGTMKLTVVKQGGVQEVSVEPVKKTVRAFTLTPIPNPTPLQRDILESWLKEK